MNKLVIFFGAVIVAICIVNCGNFMQNTNDITGKFEDFRLKWAGNNGKTWNNIIIDDGTICSVVSKNRYNKDTAAVFAKLIVGLFKSEVAVMLFLSNINCEDVTYMAVTINENYKFPFDLKVKYGKSLKNAPPNSMMKHFIGDAVDSFSLAVPTQDTHKFVMMLKTAKSITIEIPIRREMFKFEFETDNTIE